MATLTEFLEKVLPGLASGSVTALGTAYSYLKGMKDKIAELEKQAATLVKQVGDLEKRVGSTDPDTGRKSGILGIATEALAAVTQIRKDLTDLENDRSSSSGGGGGSFSSQDFSLIEDRILARVKDIQTPSSPPVKEDRIKALEDRIRRLEEKVERCQTLEQANADRHQKEQMIQEITGKVGELQGTLKTLHSILEKIAKIRLDRGTLVEKEACRSFQ